MWGKIAKQLCSDHPDTKEILMSNGMANLIPKGRSFRFADKYTFDEQSGAITKIELYDDVKTRQQEVMRWYLDIHFGTLAGQFSKLITFLAALIGASLPITGYYLWIKKRFIRTKTR